MVLLCRWLGGCGWGGGHGFKGQQGDPCLIPHPGTTHPATNSVETAHTTDHVLAMSATRPRHLLRGSAGAARHIPLLLFCKPSCWAPLLWGRCTAEGGSAAARLCPWLA